MEPRYSSDTDPPPPYSLTDPQDSAPPQLTVKHSPSHVPHSLESASSNAEPSRVTRLAQRLFTLGSPSITTLHIFRSTFTQRYYKVFNKDKTHLLYIAKRIESGPTLAMDIFRSEDTNHLLGRIQRPTPFIIYPKNISMQIYDTTRLLENNEPAYYCTHSFQSLPLQKRLTWKNKEVKAGSGKLPCTCALLNSSPHGQGDIILVDDAGRQLASFNSVRSFNRHSPQFARDMGFLSFPSNLCKESQDEIVISLLAVKRFTCCCCYFLHRCISPAGKQLESGVLGT